MIKKIKYLSNQKLCFGYFALALLICFGLNLGILKDYIFLDANEYLYTATRSSNFHDEFIQGGRPLLGYWCEFIYGYVCTTISDLKWIRLFALCISVLFSAQIFYYLLKLKFLIFESAIFAILILSLPTFTVYYSWSATAEIPILLIINFYAGQLLLKGLNQQKLKITSYITPFLIILISLFIYQSVVMVFILPIVFTVIVNQDIEFKKIVNILIFTFICFVSYFIIFKSMLSIIDLEASTRSSLSVFELPKKLIKFHIIELRTLLKGSGFLLISIPSMIVGFICFVGFFQTLKIKTKEQLLFFITLCSVFAFSYAPNILSGQSHFSLRTIAPTAILVLFYQFYFLRQLVLRKPNLKKMILILPLILLGLSAYNCKYYITDIQNTEYKTLKTTFQNIDINTTKEFTVIRPGFSFLQKNGYLKNGFPSEFGTLSSIKDWATPHLFSQLLWEASGSTDKTLHIFSPKNITVITEDKFVDLTNTTVINLNEIFEKTFSKD